MPAFEESREYPNLTAIWAVMSIGMAVVLVWAAIDHSWVNAVRALVCLVPLTVFLLLQRRASSGAHPAFSAEWPRWHRFANLMILAVVVLSSSLSFFRHHDLIDTFLDAAMAACSTMLLLQAWREYRRLTSS